MGSGGSQVAVNAAAWADLDNQDEQLLVFDGVHDAPAADAHAPQVVPLELAAAMRTGVFLTACGGPQAFAAACRPTCGG